VPVVRPFRALRFDPEVVGDLAAVVCPPYDVIGAEEHRRLLDRHPRNVVRLDLPTGEPGEEPDERYRRAARTLAGWRSDGTLHKDPRPALYVYEQTYPVPGTSVERQQRGFFGRLRLEPFGPGSGVLPHERTLEAAREDRYRLLRATGVNTSPVVALFPDAAGAAAAVLASIAGAPATIDVRDDDGVRHRLWVVPEDGEPDGPVATLTRLAGSCRMTIADGHHRYETALRYRDERRMSRSCEEDPAFDYLLTLLLPVDGDPLTVLPTHRLVSGLGDGGVAELWRRLPELFEIEGGADAASLTDRFEQAALAPGGEGRFGCWMRGRGALLVARREAFRPILPVGGDALRGLDVTLLAAALEHLCGIDQAALTGGGRVAYTKSAAEAITLVDAGAADVAFLLEPTPVTAITAVASDGDVMPQKSTYFYPKALTGLVINPHEW
jgi:uncharacterized protein (DUF1015 family)